jgi:hypothetical protein
MGADPGLTAHRVTSRKDLTEFIRFPRRLYADSPWYVPHLEFERRSFFSPAGNPFFDHAEAALFLLRSAGGETLGRISAHVDNHFNDFHGVKRGHFGFFDCVDDPSAASLLLDTAESFLRGRGMEDLIGPLNFTTNDEVGVLVEGFDSLPYIMMPYNFPYYGGLLEGGGYEKAKDLYAYTVLYRGGVPDFVARLSSRVRKSSRISVRPLDIKNLDGELALVKRIYNEAWEKNWGFVPMTDRQVEHLASELKPLINPSIVYFAFLGDEPAGFFMALPDYNVLLKGMKGRLFPFGIFRLLMGRKKIKRLRVLTMGVVKKYRHLGMEMVFLDEIYRRGPENGFTSGELSWILEDNKVMNRIAHRLCGDPYRTYRVYRKKL